MKISDKIAIFVIVLSSFIATQRFLIPNFAVYSCLIPLIVSINSYKNVALSNTAIAMSVILSIDYTVRASVGTPAPVRYIVYGFCMFALLRGTVLNPPGLKLSLAYMVLLIATTVTSKATFVIEALSRDVFITILIVITAGLTRKYNSQYFSQKILFYGIFSYLVGEFVNVILFNDQYAGGYLSFDSTKAMVLYCVIYMSYALYFKSFPLWVWVFCYMATVMVLLAYVTRMIVYMFVLWHIIFFIINLSRSNKSRIARHYSFVFSVATPLSIMIIVGSFGLEGFKVFGTLMDAIRLDTISGALESLDEVRFFESVMFFDRNIFDILFGSGVGSALVDTDLFLTHISNDAFAFSVQELTSGIFYNLHDVWTDLGLRFGLLPLACLCIFFVYKMGTRPDHGINFSIALILLFCSFYSVAGLLMISFFVRATQEPRHKVNNLRSNNTGRPKSFKKPGAA